MRISTLPVVAAVALGLVHALSAAQSNDELEPQSTQVARPSEADIGITAMMQMLRDEGIDIDTRMARARSDCRDRVSAQTAEDAEIAAEAIAEAVDECTVVEEGIIYARAINEMNANRVNNYNDAMSQYNAEVAEADRQEREYQLEMQGHNAEVAEVQRRQQQYERDMAAHRKLLAEGNFSVAPQAPQSQPADTQVALAQTPEEPAPAAETSVPAREVALALNDPPKNDPPIQTPPPAEIAEAAPPPEVLSQPPVAEEPARQNTRVASRQLGNARAADSSPSASNGQPSALTRGRVLTQGSGNSPLGEVELDVFEATGPRIALVIGNESYDGSLGSLANPVNDAVLIGATLRSVGFDVEILTDASQREMKQAVQRLGDRLEAAGDNATGLFYYAGHGVQSKGANFLIPVGSEVNAESDLELEAVSADAILAQMEEAYISTRIVILDACRNMPLRRRTRNGARGLARMETPNGSFVAYSTSPGSTAADGGGIHSPFAEALASQMLVPDRPIEVTFREVRREVVEMTGGEQVPWDSSSLLETFSFARLR